MGVASPVVRCRALLPTAVDWVSARVGPPPTTSPRLMVATRARTVSDTGPDATTAPHPLTRAKSKKRARVHWKKKLAANGTSIETPWVDGKLHGVHKNTYADGTTCETPWADGKEHGVQKDTYADGTTCETPWVDGKKQGVQKNTMPNGATCEIPWVDDKKQGVQKVTRADGMIVETLWVDGVQNESRVVRSARSARFGALSNAIEALPREALTDAQYKAVYDAAQAMYRAGDA